LLEKKACLRLQLSKKHARTRKFKITFKSGG
jgi:hypothetical protein